MDEEEREKLRRAGYIAKRALEDGLKLIREDARLLDVAEAVEGKIADEGALPGFPCNISIDTQAAHFTPRHNDGKLTFARGNLVKLDVGVHVDGYLADNARTVEVATRNWARMIQASREAVGVAVEVMRPGASMEMVGAAIERTIRSHGFKPVENLTGHSLRPYVLHADKSVPNVRRMRGQRESQTVEAGEAFAIEPFATNGAGRVEGGRPSNIYRIVKRKKSGVDAADALLEQVHRDFRTLPFSERWCHRLDARAPVHLRNLVRKGILMGYPILQEAGKGMVSQSEDTVVVTQGGAVATTVL